MLRHVRFSDLSRLAAAIAIALFVASTFAAPVGAQAPGPATTATEVDIAASNAALEDLIVTLESETGRTELIGQLKTLLDARRAQAGEAHSGQDTPSGLATLDGGALLEAVTDRVRRVGEEFVKSGQIVARMPGLLPWAKDQVSGPVNRAKWIDALSKIAAVLVIAIIAEFLVLRLLARPRRVIEARATDAWEVRLLLLLARTILELVPIAAFALAAEFALSMLEPQQITVSAARALVAANVLVRGVLVIARLFLVPTVDSLRLLAIGSETANYAYVWVRRFANVSLYGFYAIKAATILGLPRAGGTVLQQLLALVLVGMMIALILQLRETVRDRIAGAGDTAASGARARLADIWHVAAILYVVVLFCIWLLDISDGFALIARATAITLLAIASARVVESGANRLLRGLLELGEEMRERYPGLEARAGRYLPIVYGIVRTAIWFIAAMIVAEAWGLDAFEWLGSGPGRVVLGTVAQILIVALLAITVLELTSSAIERYLQRNQESGNRSARMQTLLPLLRNVLRVTVGIVATLIVLSEIGINIGPLLAGAGVAGLAIGFGAQKLVQDVINGMFIIIENTVAVGDVVRVGGHIGLCEALTIRTITLRDLSGTVHTVPFNEVTTIENLTKDFSFAVMDVGVAYREETDEVIEILHTIEEEMRGEEEYAAVMLEPLEVLGVDEFADSAVVIKVRIKTQPIKQWMVKREFNRRMKKAFDAAGIEIPFPHTTLYFGEDKKGEAPPAQVVLRERFAGYGAGARSDERDAVPVEPVAARPNPGRDLPE